MEQELNIMAQTTSMLLADGAKIMRLERENRNLYGFVATLDHIATKHEDEYCSGECICWRIRALLVTHRLTQESANE